MSRSLVLASGSPRRKELLDSVGLTVEILPKPIDETPREGEPPVVFAERMATEKAAHVIDYVIAADTVVHIDGITLGKPESVSQAIEMLTMLSGRQHFVTTGVCMGPVNNRETFSVTTKVFFRQVSEEEIVRYAKSLDPMDKAGGYGIQSGAASFVDKVLGSYTNVVGLPLAQVVVRLQAAGKMG
jgi:septum formation protein